MLLLTVLRSSHLFTNKRGPCLFTQGWGRSTAEEGRCWTGICFTSVYPHVSVVFIPSAPDSHTMSLYCFVLAMASLTAIHFANYAFQGQLKNYHHSKQCHPERLLDNLHSTHFLLTVMTISRKCAMGTFQGYLFVFQKNNHVAQIQYQM